MNLLDTSTVSHFLNQKLQAAKLKQRVSELMLSEGLAISCVTQYELRRGLEKLRGKGEGARKIVAFEKFIQSVDVLGLDSPVGAGWDIAAELWARAQLHSPALNFSEGDLLIAATAVFHERVLYTTDAKLAEGLKKLAVQVELVPIE